MIFELPDIFFGSHKKRKGITTTAGETVRIYKKGRKSLTTSGFFKKSGDIFFGATSQKVLISHEIRTFSALLRPITYLPFFLTQTLTQTGADSGKHYTAPERMLPIVFAASRLAEVVT